MATPTFAPRSTAVAKTAATPAQLDYLRSLMMDKAALVGELSAVEAAARLDAWLPTISKERASEHIENTKAEVAALRAAQPAVPAAPSFMSETVPAGRYALDTMIHAVNGTAFYRVDRPTEGKWAGRVFVKQLIGPDEQRLSQKQGHSIIARIAEVGAEAASARYGHEIGECGLCGRRLTNDDSRARGIGPVCADKAGW